MKPHVLLVGVFCFSLFALLDSAIEPISYLLFGALMVAAIASANRVVFESPHQFIIAFVIFSTLSIIVATDRSAAALGSAYLYFIYGSVLLIAWGVTTERALNQVIFWSLLGALIIYIRSGFLPELVGSDRALGLRDQPNAMAMMAAIIAMLSIVYLYINRFATFQMKAIAVLLLVLSIVWLYFTQSRSAVIAVSAALLYLFFFGIRWRARFLAVLGLGASFAGYFLLNNSVLQSPFVQRLILLPSALGLTDKPLFAVSIPLSAADSTRLDLMKTAFDGFLRSPIFGNGYHNFYLYSDFVYSHSTYFDILFSAGALGFLAYIGFLFSCFKHSSLTKTSSRRLLLARAKNTLLIYFSVHASALPVYQSRPQIIVLAVIIILWRLSNKLKAEDHIPSGSGK